MKKPGRKQNILNGLGCMLKTMQQWLTNSINYAKRHNFKDVPGSDV